MQRIASISLLSACFACFRATGQAGDVLLMHPLLIHSASSAHRVTLQCDDGRWRVEHHGIRVSFNLCTKWKAPPFSNHSASMLETGMRGVFSSPSGWKQNRIPLLYNQQIELCLGGFDRMVGVDGDGFLTAAYPRLPPRMAHTLRLIRAPKMGQRAERQTPADAIRYGDVVVLQCRVDGCWRDVILRSMDNANVRSRTARASSSNLDCETPPQPSLLQV